MSQRVARIIDEVEHEVTKLITQLEDRNGYPSHDARHLAENTQKIRLKMIDLGLDPDDTTPQELYHALLVKIEKDAKRFEADLPHNLNSFDEKSAAATELIASSFELPEQWALKSKFVKAALRANPPKRLMKYLGYRSIDSLLKRENTCELLIAAQVMESKNWYKNLVKYASGLDQTNYEMRPVKLLCLSEAKWGNIEPPDINVVYDNLSGATALWPSQELTNAPLLVLVVMLAESFIPQIQTKHGLQLVKMNLVMWWADTDHLIAELSDEHVSLNVKDCLINYWQENEFRERTTEQGRKYFWQELINRYQNRPSIEETSENTASDIVGRLRNKAPQPAYEFAEEFDG